MTSLLEQAFGTSELDLYKDVLHVSKTCTPAQLRKAYYKAALQWHPDKNKSAEAKHKFQAISWAYDLLKDPVKRQEYDEDGVIPHDNECDDDNDDGDGRQSWKDYFDLIFGKLSTDDIDNFAMKYKMSDEEEKDVLQNYTKFKGNLVKMIEYVMLSEERDVPRWMEDYIQPAIDCGKVENYESAIQKSMGQIDKKLAQEKKRGAKLQEDDSEETETEDSEREEDVVEPLTKTSKKKAAPSATASAKKAAARKAKPTKAKARSSKKNSEQDLIAAIRNKNGRANPLASIAARYGVSANLDDDPLDDAAFAKLQSKYNNKKKKK
jgi:DnaJ family protein C protein 9